jgi:thiamine kinase-like enzyme
VGALDDMLDQLQAALGPLDGKPTPLEGGITNRNYRVTFAAGDFVVRRHGFETELLGIDREAERIASEAAARLGLAPEVTAVLDGGLVTRYVLCTALTGAEIRSRGDELGRALRGFHDSDTRLPVRFWVPDLLDRYATLVTGRGRTLPDAYAPTVRAARRIAAALPEQRERPCHNDLLPGNLIRAQDDGRILIVDWEYAGMGNPLFDLGNLSVNNDFADSDDERLLAAYTDPATPDDALRAGLKLMRVLSDAREAAWGVAQGSISQLDFDFADYARVHFERLLAAVDSDQFEEWLAAA